MAHLSNDDKEHKIKAELITKFSPFYNYHPQSLISKIKSSNILHKNKLTKYIFLLYYFILFIKKK